MTHADTSGARELYRAEVIDPFGRVRKAFYGGNTVYHAVYADEGRRLMKEATVESSFGSRRVIFLEFDPLGRELSRREIKDGAASGPKTNVSYDALGRLVTAVQDRWGGDALQLEFQLRRARQHSSGSTTRSERRTRPSATAPPIAIACAASAMATAASAAPLATWSTTCSATSSSNPRERLAAAQLLLVGRHVETITEQGTQARFRYDAFGARAGARRAGR